MTLSNMIGGSDNVTSVTDGTDAVWNFAYSADGKNLISTTDPTSAKWQYNFGENGAPASRLTSITNPAGTVLFNNTYNACGQLATTTIPATISPSGQNEIVQYPYDPTTGDLTKITNPLGDSTTVDAHDALGDALSRTVYPDTGNPTTSKTPLKVTTVYDAAQMPIQITEPGGTSLLTQFTNGVPTQYTMVNLGLLHQSTTLSQMTLSRDTRGRAYAVADQVGTLVQYKYDKNSNLTRVIDGLGNTSSLSYGPNDEPTGVTWPDTHYRLMTYDVGGRVASTIDERGVQALYTYDADGRILNIQFPNYPSQNQSYTYDAAGRLLTISGATGTQTYHYDPVSKRLSNTVTTYSALPAGHNTFTIAYTYYGNGAVAAMTTPAGTTTYDYNAAGQPTSMTNPFSETTSWSYDHAGRPTGETVNSALGVPFATTYTYGVSGNGNDTSTAPAYLHIVSNSVNAQYDWTYILTHSPLGQLQYQNGQGGAIGAFSSEQFMYDNRGRVTNDTNLFQADPTHLSSAGGVYSYDLANNLLRPGGGWVYNSNNQVTAAPGWDDISGASSLGYDAAGHMTLFSGTSLTWDCWGRLSGDAGATYTYDPLGRRASRSEAGFTTFYLYSGDTLLGEIDGTGAWKTTYTWGALGLISDRVNGLSGQSRFYQFDGLGNTRAIFDPTGANLERYAWTTWGSPFVETGSALSPYGWRGRYGYYNDGDTFLIHIGARDYSPLLARFISRDPAGFAEGPNPYVYCLDDPVNLMDPSGRSVADMIDKYLMGGATANLGNAMGRYDSGKASPLEVAGAGLNWGIQAGMAANLLKDVGMVGVNVVRSGLQDAAEVAAEEAVSTGCFVAGTPVHVLSSPLLASAVSTVGHGKSSKGKLPEPKEVVIPIEKLHAGDYVLSRDAGTGRTDWKRVERTTLRKVGLVLTVSLADAKTGQVVERITATREHPFYVRGKGFVPAGGLAVGNAIVTRAGPVLVVKRVEWHRRAQGYAVYNCVVENNHTYFVGNTYGGAWVHNPDGNCAGEALGDLSGQKLSDILNKLEEEGFAERPLEPGSNSPYRTFVHPDGSKVSIDTANNVVKVNGPRVWDSTGTRKFAPRLGPHNQPYVDE